MTGIAERDLLGGRPVRRDDRRCKQPRVACVGLAQGDEVPIDLADDAFLVSVVGVSAQEAAEFDRRIGDFLAVTGDVCNNDARDASRRATGHVVDVAASGRIVSRAAGFAADVGSAEDPCVESRHDHTVLDGAVPTPDLHALEHVRCRLQHVKC